MNAIAPYPFATGHILRRAALAAGVDIEGLREKRKTPEALVHARYAAMAAMRRRGRSWRFIAQQMQRDRTTVMHGVWRAEYLIEHNADFVILLAWVEAGVRPHAGPSDIEGASDGQD